ncbi:MAG: (2Fe-2S)-binding protein [Armatimonadota bacterium]|nr:(2Fe-2S)-binding protein [Armatimonadota bacterium]
MSGGSVRIERIRRGAPLQFEVDGVQVTAFEGEHIAAALLVSGRMVLRRSQKLGEPRGLFCGIGLCFECLVQVEGMGTVLACQTPVREGMRVSITGARPTGASP